MSQEVTAPGIPAAGFTLVELLIVVVLLGIVLSIGVQGFRSFASANRVQQAAEAVAADATMTRLFALQRRETMEMAFDEAARSYAIRVRSSGDTLQTQSYSGGDLPLTRLDVDGGSVLEFNARGLLSGGATVSIEVESLGESRRVDVSAMGRTRVVNP